MRRFASNRVGVGVVDLNIHAQINYMHRMTARVVFVLLWVHSGPRVRVLAAARIILRHLTTSAAQVVSSTPSMEAQTS